MQIFSPPPAPGCASSRRPTGQSQPCLTCGDIGSPASAAVAAFNQLNQSCNSATSAVQAANLGPFHLGSSCDYDCCDSMEWKWWWDPDWSGDGKPFLYECISNVNISGNYSTLNNQLQGWLTTTLPGSGQNILGTINSIIQIEKDIIAGGGTPTPAQQQQLDILFGNAYSYTGSVTTQVDGEIQSLTGFVSNYSGYKGYLPSQSNGYKGFIDKNIDDDKNDLIGKAKCGTGTITSQFDGLKSTIGQSFSGMAPAFSTVNNDFIAALQAVEGVTGVLINLQTDLQTVIASIKKAQAEVNPELCIMNLNIAVNEWNQFVTYANSNLIT